MIVLRRPTAALLSAAAALLSASALPAMSAAATPVAARHAESTDGCPATPSDALDAAPGRGRTVALTFDDGPGATTADVIRILQRQHVTATFFNIGENEASTPSMVRTEARDGYVLGDHTWDHATLTTLDGSAQAEEIDHERITQAKLTGHDSCLFRPPGGSYDATTSSLLAERHMRICLWSVDTEDWKADGSGDAYWVHRITRRAEAGGSQQHPVILMHNQPAGNPATVSALPAVIDYYKQRGYTFVDLLGNTGRPVVNRVGRSAGPAAGGYPVTLHGANFRDVSAVHFGHAAAPAFTVVSPRTMRVTVPAHRDGPSRITVRTTDHGTTAVGTPFRFVSAPTVASVSPRVGPVRGGTRLVITGRDFVHVRDVRFGRQVVRPVRVLGDRRIVVRTPRHVAATVAVEVRTRYGRTTPHPGDHYTFR